VTEHHLIFADGKSGFCQLCAHDILALAIAFNHQPVIVSVVFAQVVWVVVNFSTVILPFYSSCFVYYSLVPYDRFTFHINSSVLIWLLICIMNAQ